MTGVLTRERRGRAQTHRENAVRRQRGCSDASTSQGLPRIVHSHQQLGDRRGTNSPSEPPEGTVPVQVLSRIQLFATPWTVACQTPLSTVLFSRQEYWNGLPFPTPGDLPAPGMEPKYPSSPALAGRFFITWKPATLQFQASGLRTCQSILFSVLNRRISADLIRQPQEINTTHIIVIYLFLIEVCVRAKSLQLCLTLCDAMDCSLPGSSVHEVLQARILECFAVLSSRDLPNPGIGAAPPAAPALQADSTVSHGGSLLKHI